MGAAIAAIVSAGPMFVSHSPEQLHDLAAAVAVESRRRLVGQDHAGLVGQSPGEGHPLLQP